MQIGAKVLLGMGMVVDQAGNGGQAAAIDHLIGAAVQLGVVVHHRHDAVALDHDVLVDLGGVMNRVDQMAGMDHDTGPGDIEAIGEVERHIADRPAAHVQDLELVGRLIKDAANPRSMSDSRKSRMYRRAAGPAARHPRHRPDLEQPVLNGGQLLSVGRPHRPAPTPRIQRGDRIGIAPEGRPLPSEGTTQIWLRPSRKLAEKARDRPTAT
jgi:hypothetical protein